jgi:hypothetical protein
VLRKSIGKRQLVATGGRQLEFRRLVSDGEHA